VRVFRPFWVALRAAVLATAVFWVALFIIDNVGWQAPLAPQNRWCFSSSSSSAF